MRNNVLFIQLFPLIFNIKRLSMKLLQYILFSLFFITQSAISMDFTTPDALLHIAALAQNHPSLQLVNKHFAALITPENMLRTYPTGCSRKDHINFMVKAAKNYKNDDTLL